MRSKDFRVQQEEKIIKKRLKISRMWVYEPGEKGQYDDQPHRLHKFNLNCGCKICHFYKYVGNSKIKYKFSDLKKKDRADEMIKDLYR